MGNVDEGVKRPEIAYDFRSCNVYSKEKCKNCFAKFYCSGGCMANAYNFHGTIHDTYEIGCEMQRKRVECAIMMKEMCIRDSMCRFRTSAQQKKTIEDTKQAVVIDPAACPSYLMSHIKSEGLKVEAILLTHGHFDHIMGIDGFLSEFDVPVYVHEDDADAMEDPALNQSSTYTSGYTFGKARYLRDHQTLELAGYTFQAVSYTHLVAVVWRMLTISMEPSMILMKSDARCKGSG